MLTGPGYQQEIVIPLQPNVDLSPRVKAKRARSPTSTRKTKSSKRARTKELLNNTFTKNSSLPMWLADLGCSFDPDDSEFFETQVKPELERKQTEKKLPSLVPLKHAVDSLRFFILKNYPEIVHPDIFDLVSRDEATTADLDAAEKKMLATIKAATAKPGELQKLHRQAQRQVKKDKQLGRKANRVVVEFANMQIFKPSFTNISLVEE
jgi:hypothetical protein